MKTFRLTRLRGNFHVNLQKAIYPFLIMPNDGKGSGGAETNFQLPRTKGQVIPTLKCLRVHSANDAARVGLKRFPN